MQAEGSPDAAILREAVSRARRLAQPVLATWTRPTSSREAIDFFARASSVPSRTLWLRPSSGEALVGVGAAQLLTGHGAGRFRQVDAAWRALLAEAVVDAGGPSWGGGPLLLGGFSFDPLRSSSTRWDGFPDARLVLPERMLAVRSGAAWLTTNVVVQPDQNQPRTQTPEGVIRGTESSLSPEAWKALVGSVARGIRHGQLGVRKVVLARSRTIRPEQPIDVAAALRNLAAGYPGCTIFAIAQPDACFLGATPERLIGLHDGLASTMALAGSAARGAIPAEDEMLAEQLLRNPKERAEHAVVVSALRDGLSRDGLCTSIIADAQPRVQKLPNLQHLFTPIRGQVAPGTRILDLVERLHPTPAVGGYPTARALELIRACESLDRGWYGGPIGWLNADGEGEFVVGIRSALVRGDSATLFAGCGILAESNPAAELAESEWKLRPMLAALGLQG